MPSGAGELQDKPMTRLKRHRLLYKAAIVALTGIVFSLGNLGCMSFFGNVGLSSIDTCFVFNCNEGAFGGTFDLCSVVNFTSFIGGGNVGNGERVSGTFFGDCPQG